MIINKKESHKQLWKYDHADSSHWPEVEGSDYVYADTKEEAIRLIDQCLTARNLRPYSELSYDLNKCSKLIIFNVTPESDNDRRVRVNKTVDRYCKAKLNRHNKDEGVACL